MPRGSHSEVTERVTGTSRPPAYNLTHEHSPSPLLTSDRRSGRTHRPVRRRLWRRLETACIDRLWALRARQRSAGRVPLLRLHARAWGRQLPGPARHHPRQPGQRHDSCGPGDHRIPELQVCAEGLRASAARGNKRSVACSPARARAGHPRIRQVHARTRLPELPRPDNSRSAHAGDATAGPGSTCSSRRSSRRRMPASRSRTGSSPAPTSTRRFLAATRPPASGSPLRPNRDVVVAGTGVDRVIEPPVLVAAGAEVANGDAVRRVREAQVLTRRPMGLPPASRCRRR